jgi:hypothetical protein
VVSLCVSAETPSEGVWTQTDFLGTHRVPNIDDPSKPCFVALFVTRTYRLSKTPTLKNFAGIYSAFKLGQWETANPGCTFDGADAVPVPTQSRMWNVFARPIGGDRYSVEGSFFDGDVKGMLTSEREKEPFKSVISISNDVLIDEEVDDTGTGNVSAVSLYREGTRTLPAAVEKALSDFLAALFGSNCTDSLAATFYLDSRSRADVDVATQCQTGSLARTAYGEMVGATITGKRAIDRWRVLKGYPALEQGLALPIERAAYVAFRVEFERGTLLGWAIVTPDKTGPWRILRGRL